MAASWRSTAKPGKGGSRFRWSSQRRGCARRRPQPRCRGHGGSAHGRRNTRAPARRERVGRSAHFGHQAPQPAGMLCPVSQQASHRACRTRQVAPRLPCASRPELQGQPASDQAQATAGHTRRIERGKCGRTLASSGVRLRRSPTAAAASSPAATRRTAPRRQHQVLPDGRMAVPRGAPARTRASQASVPAAPSGKGQPGSWLKAGVRLRNIGQAMAAAASRCTDR